MFHLKHDLNHIQVPWLVLPTKTWKANLSWRKRYSRSIKLIITRWGKPTPLSKTWSLILITYQHGTKHELWTIDSPLLRENQHKLASLLLWELLTRHEVFRVSNYPALLIQDRASGFTCNITHCMLDAVFVLFPEDDVVKSLRASEYSWLSVSSAITIWLQPTLTRPLHCLSR